MSREVNKLVKTLTAIQAAELLKSLLAHFHRVISIEFAVKIQHEELGNPSLVKHLTMLTYDSRKGITEVHTVESDNHEATA